MPKCYWLVKQEPADFSWGTFVRDQGTAWTGVRNFAARLHLRAMKRGDFALFYHSGEVKQVVGLARVTREAYPDPTATEGDWPAVDLQPVWPLPAPVSLAQIKADPALASMAIVRQSRLSVSPVTPEQFTRLLSLAGATAPVCGRAQNS